jgi:hypothetical protein
MEAYLRADGVSIVADYTCYYLVGRDDGKHVTKSGGYQLRFDSARALMGLLERMVPPGPKRDVLMVRPFQVTLLPQFGPVFLRQDEEIRRTKFELAEPLMDAYWNEGVAQRLTVQERLRLQLVAMRRPDLLVEVLEFLKAKHEPTPVLKKGGSQLYLAYPGYRSRKDGVPDRVYLAEPREAKAYPGWRQTPAETFLRGATRKVRRRLGRLRKRVSGPRGRLAA